MARIEGEIVIGQPVDVVFDYVADQSNEPQYNPRMVRAEKITAGPVGKGTQFRSAVASMGRTAEMLIEYTGYDRPALLASTTTMQQADISYTLTFEPAAAGTRMRWSGQVRPKGRLQAARPDDHLDGDTPGAADMDELEGTPGSSTASTGRAVSEPARDPFMHPVQLDRDESHHYVQHDPLRIMSGERLRAHLSAVAVLSISVARGQMRPVTRITRDLRR
jgi:hypothetical protein